MTVESLKYLSFLAVLMCVPGCVENGPANSPSKETQETLRLPRDAVNFYADRDCGPATDYPKPRLNGEFAYALIDAQGNPLPGVRRKESIRRISGDAVEYAERLEIPGASESPPENRRLRAGVLPLSAPGVEIAYLGGGKDPQLLQPGETATFPVLYTASGVGGERQAQTEIGLRFIGCKTIKAGHGVVSGEPVRVYRIQTPMLPPPPSAAPLSLTEFEWAISERSGWRMIERSPSASTMVVKSD